MFSVKTCRGGVCHGSLGEARGLRGPCSSRVGCHGRQYHFPGTVLVVCEGLVTSNMWATARINSSRSLGRAIGSIKTDQQSAAVHSEAVQDTSDQDSGVQNVGICCGSYAGGRECETVGSPDESIQISRAIGSRCGHGLCKVGLNHGT